MSTTPMKWCEKSTELAIKLHEANMEKDHANANSQAALAEIGRAVAEHVGHEGKAPNFHGVRAKLSSEKVYVPLQAPTKSKKGTVIRKTDVVETLKQRLGIDVEVGTLTNANLADLQQVAERAAEMQEKLIHNATREQLEEALDKLLEAEQDAIAEGVDVADIAEAEKQVADMMAESAENLEEQ